MRRFETPSTPMGPPQIHKGKKKVVWGSYEEYSRKWLSSSWGSSYVLNELTMYLQMSLIEVLNDDNDFDLLAWWKAYESKFLVLSTMARDILTIPTSSVALEQAFSAGGRVVNDKRTNLSEEIVECCVCLRD